MRRSCVEDVSESERVSAAENPLAEVVVISDLRCLYVPPVCAMEASEVDGMLQRASSRCSAISWSRV